MTKARNAVVRGKPKKDSVRKFGKMFFREACKPFMKVDRRARPSGYCFKHGRRCVVTRSTLPNGLRGCVAGATCSDWSSMGGEEGWGGDSALVFLCFLREMRYQNFDFIIIENTALFDESGLEPLLEYYDKVTLKFSPVLLGIPVQRVRKYMILTRRGVLQWRDEVTKLGHMQAFKLVFGRRVMMKGVDMARAPAEMLGAYKQEMCDRRGMTRTRPDNTEMSFFQCSSAAVRNQIIAHEDKVIPAHGKYPPLVCNLRQKPEFVAATEMVPALLQRSLLWNLASRRPFLPSEHLEMMGFNMFGPHRCSVAAALDALPESQQRSVAGSTMHSAAMGCVFMFLLSGAVRCS